MAGTINTNANISQAGREFYASDCSKRGLLERLLGSGENPVSGDRTNLPSLAYTRRGVACSPWSVLFT